MPIVSIIVPAYNAERFVLKALESVSRQSFDDWELIVIVDAKSTDKTAEICLAMAAKDERVTAVVGETSGLAANRNLGLTRARGRYICFLDSDDWWDVEKLELQIAFMERTHVGLSYTAYTSVSEDGESSKYLVRPPSRLNYRNMLFSNQIGVLTTMIDRTIYPRLSFSLGIQGAEDYALWLNLLRNGDSACGLLQPLAFYRRVNGSMSSNKYRTIAWRWRVLRNHEHLAFFSAGFFSITGLIYAASRRLKGRLSK